MNDIDGTIKCWLVKVANSDAFLIRMEAAQCWSGLRCFLLALCLATGAGCRVAPLGRVIDRAREETLVGGAGEWAPRCRVNSGRLGEWGPGIYVSGVA